LTTGGRWRHNPRVKPTPPGQLALFPTEDREPMRVLAHPDLHALERGLLDLVAQARDRAGPLRPILILAPTSLLARHLRLRLAGRRPAWLGVEVWTFRGLAQRILEASPAAEIRLLSPRLLEALLVRCVPLGGRLAVFLGRRPGALRGLADSLNDLREAGISAAATLAAASTAAEREVAEIYGAYERALEDLARRGLADEAGLVAAAARLAPAYARRYAAAFLHGAYELVGMQLDLLRAIHGASPVTVLLPLAPASAAGSYGERFATRHLAGSSGSIERLPDGPAGALLGARLEALYDEETRLDALPEGSGVLRHAQGAEAELGAALRRALAAVAEGVPPVEIALVARTLVPYGPSLERVLAAGREELEDPAARERGRIACTTSLAYPLRRDPVVHDLLVLLRVVVREFPRADAVELLRSPRVRWHVLLGEGGRLRGDLAERWSRSAGILGGIREWTEDFPAWAARATVPEDLPDEEREERQREHAWRRGEVSRIARALAALDAWFRRKPARAWGEHADRIEAALRELLGQDTAADTPPVRWVLELLEETRRVPAVTGAEDASPAEVLEWLERAVDETELPHGEEDLGGIRVLDAMQARGLTFRRVFLLGVHASLFPRTPRGDPFLDDAFRRRLREETLRPLPVKLEGELEERLLLSMLLGSAGEGLEVSWQRADEAGRALAPSLALREIGRMVRGHPDLEWVREAAERVPSHPTGRLEHLERATGLLTGEEEALLVALRSPNPASARAALAGSRPDLARGLGLVQATESFAPRELAFDGRVGRLARVPETFTVSSLETLGQCPLRFFFGRVLAVRELEEAATPYDIPRQELGHHVHRILEAIYRRLLEEGRFGGGTLEELHARARELVEPTWAEEMREAEERRGRRLGLLWKLHAEQWKEALLRFVAADLERVVNDGWSVAALEQPVPGRLDLGGGIELALSLRFDRVLRRGGDGETCIGDYKTGGALYRAADLKPMLRGHRVQVPLYHLTGGGAVELMGVGPRYEAEGGSRVVFQGFEREPDRTGFLETLRALVSLARSGRFPLNPEERRCGYCGYRPACRHNHPPTLEREDCALDAADLRALQEKSTNAPTLFEVRERRRQRTRP
jgi:ATP-dependent helicase/nuclease subunit B